MALGDLITGGVSNAVQGVADTIKKLGAQQGKLAAETAARLAVKAVPEPEGEREINGKKVVAVLLVSGAALCFAYYMGWIGNRKRVYRGRGRRK